MPDKEQREQLDRVSSRIGLAITEFCLHRIGKQFFMEELRSFVTEKIGQHVAPASPDRILRALRQERKLDYKVVSRRKSLYEVLPVPEKKSRPPRPKPVAPLGQQPSLF